MAKTKRASKPTKAKEVRTNGVKRARLMAELTQAELAHAVGVSRQTVVSIESGDYAPSVYLALGVAVELGMTVEELFDDGK